MLPARLTPLADALQDSRTALMRPDRDAPAADSTLPGGVREGRRAAVLILIGLATGADGDDPFLVLTERSATLRSHPGQISFPGGAVDPGDDGPVDTALREAEEEIGLDRDGVQVFGQLPAGQVAVSGFNVTAVLGWWRTPARIRVVDPREVAAVHRVGVRELTDPARRGQVRHPSGYVGPAFQLGSPADPEGGLLLWGFTAHLVDAVLSLAGWQRPWDESRRLTIPERHLHDRRKAARP